MKILTNAGISLIASIIISITLGFSSVQAVFLYYTIFILMTLISIMSRLDNYER